MFFLPYSHSPYECITEIVSTHFYLIFQEPWIICQDLNVFTKIVWLNKLRLYSSSNLYAPWIIRQDSNLFTNIVRSYTQISYSSSHIYVPWLIRQDLMILLFDYYLESSVRIQLRYYLAWWFDAVSQKTPLKPKLESSN